jgi:hypothetical protein
VHVVLWNRSHAVPAIWRHGWQRSTGEGFKFFDLSEPVFVSYAAGLFVLGFMWVAWLPVLVDAVAGLRRIGKQLPTREVPGADAPVLVWLTVMTVVLTYVLTSFRTWSNLRYFALLYPLFLLLSYAALVRLGLGERARQRALLGLVLLFALAAFRSVDPLSRAVYGTFDAGEKRMYNMSSITGEFEGPGRDQLVYNTEFTGLHHVQNTLYGRIAPTDSTVIATARHVRWNIWSQLDSATLRRTMRREAVVVPVYADEFDALARKSREFWLLEFSNRGDKDRSLTTVLAQYRVVDSVSVAARGHALLARRLVRREAAGLP